MSTALSEIIRRAIESRLVEVHTALIGRVVSYDSANQCADIELVSRRPLVDGSGNVTHETLPILPDVPIAFPRGGGFAITWPLNPGDAVQVVFNTYSAAEWVETGEPSNPGDTRAHGLGSAVAYPCVATAAQTLAGAAEPALVLEGQDVRLGAHDAAEAIALASKVAANLNALKSAIAGAPNGDAIPGLVGSVVIQDMAAARVKAK